MTSSRTASVIAALALLAALTGCASPVANAKPVMSANDSYIAAVTAVAPSLDETADRVLIATGKGVCSTLGDGGDAGTLADKAIAAGLTAIEAQAIIESAITVYCPSQSWSIDA